MDLFGNSINSQNVPPNCPPAPRKGKRPRVEDDGGGEAAPAVPLGRQLGEGHQGSVYELLGTAVKTAVKVVQRRRAQREEDMLRRVQGCPHVLRYVDAWSAGDERYIQTELCGGGRLGREEPDPERLLLQLCLALDHCHDCGVAHLDVKPDNVLRRLDGSWVLADFGMARDTAAGYHEEGDRTTMAPELLSDDRVDLTKADVFSLGLTVLAAATGRALPGHGDGWHKLRSGDAKEVLNGLTLSGTLRKALGGMLRTDPKARLSCSELLRLLRSGH